MELEEKDFEDMISVVDQDKDGMVSEEEFFHFIALGTAHW